MATYDIAKEMESFIFSGAENPCDKVLDTILIIDENTISHELLHRTLSMDEFAWCKLSLIYVIKGKNSQRFFYDYYRLEPIVFVDENWDFYKDKRINLDSYNLNRSPEIKKVILITNNELKYEMPNNYLKIKFMLITTDSNYNVDEYKSLNINKYYFEINDYKEIYTFYQDIVLNLVYDLKNNQSYYINKKICNISPKEIIETAINLYNPFDNEYDINNAIDYMNKEYFKNGFEDYEKEPDYSDVF